MPTYPASLLDPLTGLPKKKAPAYPTNNGLGGESKADSPFTNPILPGTTTSGAFPGSTSVPGYTPDYAALINADPLLGQTQSDFQAQGITDAASRNAAINRALIQFGKVPDLASAQQALGLDVGSLVDPTTAGLAAGNKFSTQATLGDALSKQIRGIRQGLASRGGLQSGELGYQLGEANKAYGAAENDATQGLLDKIGGYQSQYAEGQRQAQAAVRQAQQDAALRQAQMNPATGSQTASLAYTDANGQPVYRGADGRLYDLNGNAYNGPGQGQQTTPPPANYDNITNDSPVPGYGPGVTNGNLADLLFGGTLGFSRP